MSGSVWNVAIDSLRANKVKAFLTMLGVVIGSACIVLDVTISLVGRQYIVAQIEGVGSNLVYAQLIRNGAQSTTLSDELTLGDLTAARTEISDAQYVAATHDLQMAVVAQSVERPVTLVAVTEDFQVIRNLLVLSGRYFDTADFESRGKVCLLSQDLARIVFPDSDPVGQEIRVGELRFTIIGVFKERIATFGQSEIAKETVVVPFGLLKSYAGTESVRVLYVQAPRPDVVPIVTDQLSELLQARHRAGARYQVQNLGAILEAARKVSYAVMMVLLAVVRLHSLSVAWAS